MLKPQFVVKNDRATPDGLIEYYYESKILAKEGRVWISDEDKPANRGNRNHKQVK